MILACLLKRLRNKYPLMLRAVLRNTHPAGQNIGSWLLTYPAITTWPLTTINYINDEKSVIPLDLYLPPLAF